MAGQLGGLARSTRPEIITAATDLARTWTLGWTKKDRTELEAFLAQVEEITGQNEAVYQKAADTLKALSAGEAALAKAWGEFNNIKATFEEESAATAQRLIDQETALDKKRRLAEGELQRREDAVKAREAAVEEREAAMEAKEAEVKEMEADMALARAAAEESKAEADKAKADFEARMAAQKKIWG